MGNHLIDDSSSLILTSLRGLCRSNPHLTLDTTHRVCFIKPSTKRVHLVSGGGSGHEPAMAGYVGTNMLDCAVAGDVFASPSASAVTAGVVAMGDNPVLIIVFSYTGDRLHFGMAVEKLNRLGGQADMVVVDDDVSVGRKQGGRVGRRGLAGTVLVHKIAGGAAQSGQAFAAVKKQAQEVVANLVTVGASLTHASVPGSSGEESQLAQDEIEIGMGIHNEPGFQKIKTPPANELVELLLKQLLDQHDQDRAFVPFKANDEVVLLINNLGAISNVELYAFTQIVADQVESDWKLKIVRTYTGNFVTSLDGAGASITLLNLSNMQDSDLALSYLDLPTTAPGWNCAAEASAWSSASQEVVTKPLPKEKSDAILPVDEALTRRLIDAACNALIQAEPEITKYDTIAGDGDAGQTLKSASLAVQEAVKNDKISLTNAVDVFGDIAGVLEESMGGTGGALYTIFFAALAAALASSKTLDSATMANAITAALERLQTYTTATIGDKTMMDALIPFAETLSKTASFDKAVSACEQGALSTKGMAAGLGRASYVEASESQSVPDAGAMGIAKLVRGLQSALA
ncbi:Dak1 domain-domain-containing protein [Protomyces lactucae-debilis]|uniref:Dak1 domain-domain-containing protein n=1 Tax=Protomyces lactucae-debilis TaxID=2754530 RepID=A0A1Y2EZC5_PROLT|nr:Dak1 domain-containing protein [Protomyces lactucae-debilis]ORY76095.1 Dak1 domain-domain-containing protein [Protomyces lactucae-debilis]